MTEVNPEDQVPIVTPSEDDDDLHGDQEYVPTFFFPNADDDAGVNEDTDLDENGDEA